MISNYIPRKVWKKSKIKGRGRSSNCKQKIIIEEISH